MHMYYTILIYARKYVLKKKLSLIHTYLKVSSTHNKTQKRKQSYKTNFFLLQTTPTSTIPEYSAGDGRQRRGKVSRTGTLVTRVWG